MKKVLCLLICAALVLSLGACGKSDENNDGTKSEVVVTEKIDKQEKNPLESKDASLKYIGIEKANEQLAGDRDNMYIFKFDFVNNTSEPKQPQNCYSISFFQNGQELQDSFTTVIFGENEQNDLIGNFFDRVMDGGKLTFAIMVQTLDDSPVTIYIEQLKKDSDPVSLKVDVNKELSVQAENSNVETTVDTNDTF